MIDPAKVMHKIDNDDFAINFRDAFISNEHVKLLREIFKNVDYKNLDAINKALIDFFKQTKFYIKVIDNPISETEKEINEDSMKRINHITNYFSDASFTSDCHYYE
jgi:hypothetical protein